MQSTDRSPDPTPNFTVILGADYAGKSSAMGRLAAGSPPWRFVSVDNDFLTARYALIARLRRDLITDVLAPDGRYSAEFLTAMLQTAVVHLRDRIIEDVGRSRTIVDSYYYKILAKCRLAGVPTNHPILQWWRSFPQPRRIVYLDRSLDSAWQRSSRGAALNRLEYYVDVPDRAAFDRYQTDLDRTIREEITAVPVTVIDERTPELTAQAIREVLHDGT